LETPSAIHILLIFGPWSFVPFQREDLKMASNEQAPDAPVASHSAAAAFEALLPEISAVPEGELTPITTDVVASITTVLGALPRIRALRGDIDKMWRQFDFAEFDKLEQYAHALHQANARWRAAANAPKVDVAPLAADLADVRDRLFAGANLLVDFKVIDGKGLEGIKQTAGYRALSSDVSTLVQVLSANWATIANKLPVTLADLNRYAEQALAFLTSVGLREQAQTKVTEAALQRQQAYTLLERAYGNARRAVLYLRPKDGEEIAPSLYAGRGGRGRAEAEAVEEVEGVVTAPEPVAAAASSATAKPTGAPSTQSSTTTAAIPIVINNPNGLPATAPFLGGV
jgi:hypothetical protein